jgi:mRNA-degrading endonuclease RelE of RelBE toxin-antitoxin system
MGPRGGDRRSGAGQPKGASRATRPATATPPSPAPSGGRAPKGATTPTPWRLRFSARIIDEDLDDIGRAAFDVAMAAIDKKLRVDPHQYGDGLGPPLAGLMKLKASHVRIAYHVVDDAHEVWVLMLGDRQDIWKRREGDILERLATVKTRIVDEARRRSAAVEKKAPRPRHGGGGKGAR